MNKNAKKNATLYTGIEPVTFRLTAECSTTELTEPIYIFSKT